MTNRQQHTQSCESTWPSSAADLLSLQRLEEELGIYEAIIASSDDAIVSKTLDGIITSWNHAAEKLFGYPAQEAIGQPITLIIPAELRSEEEDIIGKLRRGIHIQHYETVRQRKDGTRVEVSLSISPVKDRAGKIIGAAKIARDITERKRIQAEIQQSRDQLGIILQGVADGIIVYAPDSRIIYANEAAARMTDSASVQQMQATPPSGLVNQYELIDEQGKPFPRSQLTHLRVLAGEQEAQAIIGYTKVGMEQPESWSLVKSCPVLSENGKVAMVITIIHDITNRMRAERRKDEFISMMSHELKTPLTSLKGFTNLLQRRLTKQEDTQGLHYLSRIDTQLDKLTRLISELLDISRMQLGKLALRMEPVDLDGLIDETVENVQATSSTHRLLIEGRTDAQVMGDYEHLGQVFINLLTNAIKYSPGAEKVLVRLLRDEEQAIVSIQDFGIGIDKAHHEKIFERFYQVSNPEHTYPGLGIGLYISNEIVTRHKGRMWVESSRGKGATFFVALPI